MNKNDIDTILSDIKETFDDESREKENSVFYIYTEIGCYEVDLESIDTYEHYMRILTPFGAGVQAVYIPYDKIENINVQ